MLNKFIEDYFGSKDSLRRKAVEGMVYRESGDYVSADKAAKEIGEMVKLEQNNLPAEAMVEAIQLLLETGNKETAENLVQIVVKNNEKAFFFAINRTKCLFCHNNCRQCINFGYYIN